MQYISNTESDKAEMLKALGVRSVEELLGGIPAGLRLKDLKLAAGLSEMELLRDIRRTGQKNAHADRFASFLGAGNYDHYIPSIVPHLAMRGEFITSYTPYQGEASQGTLQFIYEFQSLICNLTGMDVANASMYDGASSVAEAALMALRGSDRKELLVAEGIHPESLETLRTYLANLGTPIIRVPERGGVMDLDFLKKRASDKTAAVIYQSPNFLGYAEDGFEIARLAKARGAVVIASVNPLSLGLFASPGETGADIAVGEGQPLGNAVSYGGPHFGFFAARWDFLRRMPGRICGLTEDRDGRRAFVLTLQAREQHIRREKATSNICTNHSLCALKATIFLAALGEKGFRRMGELNLERARKALAVLKKVPGVKSYADAPFFNEFTVTIRKDARKLAKSLEERRILGPLGLGRFAAARKGQYLVAVTEQRTDEEIARLAEAIRKV